MQNFKLSATMANMVNLDQIVELYCVAIKIIINAINYIIIINMAKISNMKLPILEIFKMFRRNL